MSHNSGLMPLQITVKEAARILGYSQRTIYRLLDRRELQSVGRGRLLRVDYASVEAYHQHQRAESEAA